MHVWTTDRRCADGPNMKASVGDHVDTCSVCFNLVSLQVYVPALDLTFTVSKETRIFACQNPVAQGGGRKQLPKSFLNRFSRVCVLVDCHE